MMMMNINWRMTQEVSLPSLSPMQVRWPWSYRYTDTGRLITYCISVCTALASDDLVSCPFVKSIGLAYLRPTNARR